MYKNSGGKLIRQIRMRNKKPAVTQVVMDAEAAWFCDLHFVFLTLY